MPPLEEGDLLYMPTTDPGISMTKARELLQQTDRLIKQFPEVQSVMGKVGRAETATDPAPVSMFETTITLERDKSLWRQVPVPRFYDGWPGWARGCRRSSGPPRGPSRSTNWSTATSRPGLAPRAGAQRDRPDSRPDQLLDHAHPHPHRHALDRHQDPRGHQDHGAGPGRPVATWPSRSPRPSRPTRGPARTPPARSPRRPSAARTWTSPSTATRSPATACPSPTCRTSSPRPWAA